LFNRLSFPNASSIAETKNFKFLVFIYINIILLYFTKMI
jgi:hypothetical protein